MFICNIGEIDCNEQINYPLKKIEIQTFNAVINLTLSQLKDQFDSSNISPLKDLFLFTKRRTQEISKNSNALP